MTPHARRYLASLGWCALIVYLPFTWVFFIDYPWNEYRRLWASLFPVLPGFLPARLIAGANISTGPWAALAGVLTLAVLLPAARLAMLSRPVRMGVYITLALGALALARASYAAFRM